MPEAEVIDQPIVETAIPDSTPLTQEGQSVAQILEMASKDATFAALPEVKAIVEAAGKVKTTKEKTEENTEEEEETDDKTKSKSVFFGNKKGSPVPEFKTVDEMQPYIEKFGLKNPSELFVKAEKWRNDSQELPKLVDENNGYKQLFDNMPQEVYDIIQVWGKGGDWQEAMRDKAPTMNFGKSFEKQQFEIVNKYFPNQFTEAELKDTNDSVAKNAIAVAKEKFNLGKEQLDHQRAAALEKAGKTATAIKQSALSSVEKLQEEFPDFSARQLGEVKQILVGGDLNSLFFNKDGTVKPEAAVMLALAKYGKAEITGKVASATKKAKADTQNEILMQHIERGKKTPDFTKGNETATLPTEVMKTLSGLNKKPTY